VTKALAEQHSCFVAHLRGTRTGEAEIVLLCALRVSAANLRGKPSHREAAVVLLRVLRVFVAHLRGTRPAIAKR
jgi:hypothetical protein